MRGHLGGMVVLGALAACAPSRSYLFDPVAASVRERTGIRPEWRSGWRRSPAVDKRIGEVVASPLTADGAASIAVLNSSELQAAYEELGVAGGRLAAARLPENPQVEAQLRFPLDGGSTQIEVSAVQSVTSLLAILPRTNGADAELRSARRRAVALTVDTASRARVGFFAAAAAEQTLSIRRTIAEAAAASAELARRLHDAGNITDLDFTRETVFEEEARLAAGAAEAESVAARERLNAILGLHGEETAWRIEGRLPRPPESLADVDDLEKRAIAASLDLEALRRRIEAAGQAIGVARLESFVPDLGIGVSAKREDDWGVGPMVTLSVPIFDWGQGARATAWARLRRLQHQYTAVAVDVRAAARAAGTRLVAAHRRAVRIGTSVLPLRERLLDEALRQYNAMNLSPFDLLIVRREHIQAEERYIQALRDYWVAQTEVDELRAGALPRTAPMPTPIDEE